MIISTFKSNENKTSDQKWTYTYRDSDDTLLSNLLHSTTYQVANFLISVCRNCSNLVGEKKLVVRNLQPEELKWISSNTSVMCRTIKDSSCVHSNQTLTCAISSDVLIILAWLLRWEITASTAMLIPLHRSIAFMPAATDLHPSEKITRVSTVAAVVPVKPISLCQSMIAPRTGWPAR